MLILRARSSTRGKKGVRKPTLLSGGLEGSRIHPRLVKTFGVLVWEKARRRTSFIMGRLHILIVFPIADSRNELNALFSDRLLLLFSALGGAQSCVVQ